MAKVLIPLPDKNFDTTEVAVLWRLLRGAGHRLAFATGRGRSSPIGAAVRSVSCLLAVVLAFAACGRAATTVPPRTADEGSAASPRCPEGTVRVTISVGTGTPSDSPPTTTTRCTPPDDAARMQASGAFSCHAASDESLQCVALVPSASR